MDDDLWITNPLTLRKIKIGGRIHRLLMKTNVLKPKEKKEDVEIKEENPEKDKEVKPRYILIKPTEENYDSDESDDEEENNT